MRSWLRFREPVPVTPPSEIRVLVDDPTAIARLSQGLRTHLAALPQAGAPEIVVLCIGTDRSTGDALGPLAGTQLSTLPISGLTVLGTLEHPVHATNLRDTMADLSKHHADAIIIAIDACLGQLDSVGRISCGTGPLKPGAGVQKDLPAVGHLHLTGIVNVGGFMEYMVLQNTRLSLVMRMAQLISTSVYLAARTYLFPVVDQTSPVP